MSRADDIKLFVIDVDGTMTDGGIYYDENGNETKKFCTKDAAGFFTAHQAGMEIMVLTGRECRATTRRMQEMKVDYLCQDVQNKRNFLDNFMAGHGLNKANVAYIGDDLNDFPPMELAGFVGCPADSCEEIRSMADYVSPIKGGYGAVRDIISHVLKLRNQWEESWRSVYYGKER